jgi:hypothetical protein
MNRRGVAKMIIGKHSFDKEDFQFGFFVTFATLIYVLVGIVFI